MKPGLSYSFRLEKQYFDCIDDRGNCFIIYRVELHLFFIKIHYSELNFCDSYNITTGKSSLRKTVNPESGELLNYINTPLDLRGSWKRIDGSLPSYLFRDSENRELIWNCHHPKALTDIAHNGRTFRGYGYGETLFLTIKPWNLPIEELRWGRFLSDEYTIIWINWKGTHPLNKLYCNGKEYNDALFENDRINFDAGNYFLIFTETAVIRKGKLSSLFTEIPWMKIFINNRILNISENKFKSKSILSHNSEIKASGWSLYEIVRWKN